MIQIAIVELFLPARKETKYILYMCCNTFGIRPIKLIFHHGRYARFRILSSPDTLSKYRCPKNMIMSSLLGSSFGFLGFKRNISLDSGKCNKFNAVSEKRKTV